MGKTCVMCGKPSGMYPLCREHLQMKAAGKIVKCDDCGTWHYADRPCECEIKETDTEKETIRQDHELTCIICGQPSNGKHFCKACYFKYKDRSVDIRITNCTKTQILDEYGNLIYKTDDGRKVRSRAEKIISDFLFNNKVRAVYEQTLYYTEDGETKTLHPDFYLPDYELYIEYNEITNKPYLKRKSYAQGVYDSMGKKVLIMTEQDLMDIAACLKPKLGLH